MHKQRHKQSQTREQFDDHVTFKLKIKKKKKATLLTVEVELAHQTFGNHL